METGFGKKNTYMTFIFGLLVVWVHSVNTGLFGVELKVEDIISRVIGQIAVPGFFMISSYLFFRNYTISSTPGKWKRRIKSVLIPYLAWNCIYYAGYLIASLIPALRALTGVGEVPFDLITVIRAVFFYEYNPVFWFIWQLIFLFVLSPVIYLLVKNAVTACIWLAFLLVLVYFGIDTHSLNPDAVFYYSLAAMIAVHLRSYAEPGPLPDRSNGNSPGSFLCGLFMITAGFMCIYPAGWTGNSVFLVIMRALVPIGVWCILPGSLLPDPPDFMKNSFLIYAMHFAMVRFINKAGAAVLPHTKASAMILYLMMPAAVYAAVGFAAGLLRKYTPKLYDVLSGGR